MDLWAGPLQVEVEPLEVWRALGYRAGTSPTRPVAERLDTLWPHAITLLQPRGAYRLVGADQATRIGMEALEQVAVGLCTVGPELEIACTRHQASGEALDALLLDAIGSTAAEAAADALNALICDHAARLGLGTDPRESPGYGGWDISCQPRLLALLPAAELGVSLTPGLMMTPRKSVSFAVRLLERPGHSRISCERCGLTTCQHRRFPVEDPGPGRESRVESQESRATTPCPTRVAVTSRLSTLDSRLSPATHTPQENQ